MRRNSLPSVALGVMVSTLDSETTYLLKSPFKSQVIKITLQKPTVGNCNCPWIEVELESVTQTAVPTPTYKYNPGRQMPLDDHVEVWDMYCQSDLNPPANI